MISRSCLNPFFPGDNKTWEPRVARARVCLRLINAGSFGLVDDRANPYRSNTEAANARDIAVFAGLLGSATNVKALTAIQSRRP